MFQICQESHSSHKPNNQINKKALVLSILKTKKQKTKPSFILNAFINKGYFFPKEETEDWQDILSTAQFLAHEPIPNYCIYKNRILKSASFDIRQSLHSKLSP